MKSLDFGLSGCNLEIVSPGVIRKMVLNPEYGDRLVKQAQKQIEFFETNMTSFKTPKIFMLNVESPQYFEMEYIPGSSFSEYFNFAPTSNIDLILKCIFEYLDSQFGNSELKNVNAILCNKLENLKSASKHKILINKLILLCNKEIFKIPISNCHGDLTLANMLFKDGHVYLIDFLDSYLNSVLVDLAKLKQDLYHNWSPILLGETQLRIYNICDYMWTKLERRYKSYLSNPAFDMIEIINLLRIEPYLKGEFQGNLLDKIIREVDTY
jgi:serine/threonine protein kinase